MTASLLSAVLALAPAPKTSSVAETLALAWKLTPFGQAASGQWAPFMPHRAHLDGRHVISQYSRVLSALGQGGRSSLFFLSFLSISIFV